MLRCDLCPTNIRIEMKVALQKMGALGCIPSTTTQRRVVLQYLMDMFLVERVETLKHDRHLLMLLSIPKKKMKGCIYSICIKEGSEVLLAPVLILH